MQILHAILQFLKRHYEKIILCVVLLGLAGAAISMGNLISNTTIGDPPLRPAKVKPLPPLPLSNDVRILAEVTNPPPVVLSGDHNLFNPVTWKRTPSQQLLKILTNGPDALLITNITALYTVISYDHPTGSSNTYAFSVQQHSGRKSIEYPKIGEKPRSGLYVIRGIKGAPTDPDEFTLEIPASGETITMAKAKPYKREDSYIVDLRYNPESHTFTKQKVGDIITLDYEQYKIVDITNNAVTVQATKNTKQTTIKWNGSP